MNGPKGAPVLRDGVPFRPQRGGGKPAPTGLCAEGRRKAQQLMRAEGDLQRITRRAISMAPGRARDLVVEQVDQAKTDRARRRTVQAEHAAECQTCAGLT